MRQAHGQSISRISLGCFTQAQKRSHHKRNLLLFSATTPHHRLFDTPRRILKNGDSTGRNRKNGSPSSAPQNNRSFVTLHVNDGFKCGRPRRKLRQDLLNFAMNRHETPRLQQTRRVSHHPPCQSAKHRLSPGPGALNSLQDSVPCSPQGRIDSQNAFSLSLNLGCYHRGQLKPQTHHPATHKKQGAPSPFQIGILPYNVKLK